MHARWNTIHFNKFTEKHQYRKRLIDVPDFFFVSGLLVMETSYELTPCIDFLDNATFTVNSTMLHQLAENSTNIAGMVSDSIHFVTNLTVSTL